MTRKIVNGQFLQLFLCASKAFLATVDDES